MLVRPSARARTRLAYKTCLRTPQREDAVPKSPEARRQFTRTEPPPEGVWGLCDVAPVSEERTPNGCAAQTRRRGSTGNRIQFARALASQRPPSRERPPLGGSGAGRALFPSLWLSPRPRSIDDAEHGRRQVRGPAACSSAGTSLSAAAAAAAAALCKESQLPAFPAAGRWPRGAVGPGVGHDGVQRAAGLPSRTLCVGAASLGEVRQGRSHAATCTTGLAGDRPRHPRKPFLNPTS